MLKPTSRAALAEQKRLEALLLGQLRHAIAAHPVPTGGPRYGIAGPTHSVHGPPNAAAAGTGTLAHPVQGTVRETVGEPSHAVAPLPA